MNKEEFNNLYGKFNVPKSRSFTEDDWDNALKDWEQYYTLIISQNGLPLERWLKNESDGYLPDFLDTKEKRFGHARIGNYDQVMIYKYTGTDKARKGKYIDVYKSKDTYYDSTDDIKDNYENKIKKLLKNIVGAPSQEKLHDTEKSDEYKEFSNKQILRKMSILTSLRNDSEYNNAFMWIYNERALDTLAKIFEVDDDSNKTFLQKNKDIYDKAKKYAEVTNTFTKEDYIKLNNFLWFLSDPSYKATELIDFNSINIIFNGAPGTGKTYGVTKGIEKLQSINSSKFKESKYIQFHPTFTYQDFIEGIKPFGIVSGNLNLQVVNGSFKQFCIKVRKENENYYSKLPNKPNPEKPSDFIDWPHYYFVVDEINRGNLSSIFGETFTLLEYRDYDFSGEYNEAKTNLVLTMLSSVIARIDDKNVKEKLIYKEIDGEIYFGIPFNIHFIGMMNDVDRSIDPFDLALRRRFKWIQKYCDYDVIKDELADEGYQLDDVKEYVESCRSLNDMICDATKNDGLRLGKNYEIGHAFFLKIKDIPTKNKKITNNNKNEVFENYIAGTLKEYIRQVADDSEIDGWIDKARVAFGIN